MHKTSALLALPLAALLVAAVWLRPHAPAYPTYDVARFVPLLQTRFASVAGRTVTVSGYYHHGCPSCMWDAPPSLTVGASWGGPSIAVDLPDAPDDPWWIARWRSLPLLGRLAPAARSGRPEGFTRLTGVVGIACPPTTFCDGPTYLLRVVGSR